MSPDVREKLLNIGKKFSNAVTPELAKPPGHKSKIKSSKTGTPAHITKKIKQPSITTMNEIRKTRVYTPQKKIFLPSAKIQTPAERNG